MYQDHGLIKIHRQYIVTPDDHLVYREHSRPIAHLAMLVLIILTITVDGYPLLGLLTKHVPVIAPCIPNYHLTTAYG